MTPAADDLSIFLCGAPLDLSAGEQARIRELLDELQAERIRIATKAEGRSAPMFGRPAGDVGDVAQRGDEGRETI